MRIAVVVASLLALGACEKSKDKEKPKETVKDGVRYIPVEAGSDGYDPRTIKAKPNEDLVLIFTRTAEGECTSQVKVADGPVIDLPMHEEVEVPVKAPASGKLAFACGMDMMTGVIAVQ
jgi:plastocyanin domain-containing protein